MNVPRQRLHQGFTLIELIIVLTLIAIMASALVVFIMPAANSFAAMRVRADMADQADTTMRRLLRDVRRAVPNSLRLPSDQCFELVPSVSGGRYRMGPDLANEPSCDASQNASGSCAAWVDTSSTTTSFDVLSSMSTIPTLTASRKDWVVIDNQNGNDVYQGSNARRLSAVTQAPGSPTPTTTQGTVRLTMVSSLQVPQGYTSGRFQTVSDTEQSVFYICSGADGSVDASGNGKGTLYRLVRSFTASYPTSCPATTGAAVMATNVQSCSFVYNPNQGSTQQSGYLLLSLKLSYQNESAQLVGGAHVINVP